MSDSMDTFIMEFNRKKEQRQFVKKEFIRLLARKARDLSEGMRDRVKRDPDLADYEAGFTPILDSFLEKFIHTL